MIEWMIIVEICDLLTEREISLWNCVVTISKIEGDM